MSFLGANVYFLVHPVNHVSPPGTVLEMRTESSDTLSSAGLAWPPTCHRLRSAGCADCTFHTLMG